MATRAVHSFEGTISGERGGVIGELTPELTTSAALASAFTVETAHVFIGGGQQGVVQRLYIEADTEGLTLTPSIIIDGTVTALATFSSSVGVKQQFEYAINRTGFIVGVRIEAAAGTLTKRIEISAIEVDCYIPTPAGGR